MGSRTGAVTDAAVAAETIVGYVVVQLLLTPPRMNRLVLSSSPLPLLTVLNTLLDTVGLGMAVQANGVRVASTDVAITATAGPQLTTDTLRTAQSTTVAALVGAYRDARSSPEARALVRYVGMDLSSRLVSSNSTTTTTTTTTAAMSVDDVLWVAHASALVQALSELRVLAPPSPPPRMPDGAPI
jgi:hypothetical protein